jgi:hypothetical protein
MVGRDECAQTNDAGVYEEFGHFIYAANIFGTILR